jgi:hypothetical protein
MMDGDSDDDDADDVAATPRRSCGLELTGEWPRPLERKAPLRKAH